MGTAIAKYQTLNPMSNDAVERQREYYARSAEAYDEMHLAEPEHELALAQLTGYLQYYSYDSLLPFPLYFGCVKLK